MWYWIMFFCYFLDSVTVSFIHGSNGFTLPERILTGHTIITLTNVDWLRCIQHCRSTSRCLSYNFFPDQNVCELNDFAFGEPCEAEHALIKTSGWIYHQLNEQQELLFKGRTDADLKPLQNITANITCDNTMKVFFGNLSYGDDNGNWKIPNKYVISSDSKVISIEGIDHGGAEGILGSFSNGLLTNESWKCTDVYYPGWHFPDFDDGAWPAAVVVGKYGDQPWGNIENINHAAKWIWTADSEHVNRVYCRLLL